MSGEKPSNFPLRLDPELRRQVQEVARRNHRSINAEIVVAIEAHIKRESEKRND